MPACFRGKDSRILFGLYLKMMDKYTFKNYPHHHHTVCIAVIAFDTMGVKEMRKKKIYRIVVREENCKNVMKILAAAKLLTFQFQFW